jgi:hypothetical protein
VQARGHRFTATTPAGAIGNDLPLVKTEERWNAILMGITVKSVVDDPRTGKETMQAVSRDIPISIEGVASKVIA